MIFFPVIYEDEELLVINKPAGLVCHPTKGDELSSLISRVRLHLGQPAVYPEPRDGFDLEETVTRERRDGLLAAHRRAAQDPLDREILQAEHESFGLAAPDGRQGPQHVGPLPAALVTRVRMSHYQEHLDTPPGLQDDPRRQPSVRSRQRRRSARHRAVRAAVGT